MKTTDILNKLYCSDILNKADLLFLLSRESDSDLKEIFDFADKVRQEYMGDSVFFARFNRNFKLLQKFMRLLWIKREK